MSYRKLTGLLVAGLVLVAGCGGDNAVPPDPSPTTLTIGTNIEASTFDPAGLRSSPGTLVPYWQGVYDTLLLRLPDGTIAPNMASWTFDDSQTLMTLALRDGMRFADGSPITAEAVVASMDRFRQGSGPDATYLADVTSLRATSQATIEMRLSEPDPGMIYKLSSSAGAIANPAGFGDDIATRPASSGPYVLDDAATTAGVVHAYERNPYYWNPAAYPYDRIEIRYLSDLTARANALRSGQVDATVLDAQSKAGIENLGLRVTPQSAAWEGLYLFDRAGEKVPALADLRVRQAMNMAFDREGIAEFLMLGTVEPNDQIFRRGTGAFAEGRSYPYDLERARQLMAEAGYPDGFDLPMSSTEQSGYIDPIIVSSLADIGVRVQLQAVPYEQLSSRTQSGEWGAAWYRYTQDAPWIDFTRHVLPNAPLNPFHSQTPELDGLLQAAQVAGPQERQAAEAAVGAYLFDNAWFVPLFNASQLIGHQPSVEVVPQVGLNVLPLRNYVPATASAPAP